MKFLTAIITTIIGSALVSCNHKIKHGGLFVPKQIQWDTLKGGFEIKEITPEMLIVERENKKDTIFLAHYTDHKVHKQSINRVKQWIYGKYPAPEIVIPN